MRKSAFVVVTCLIWVIVARQVNALIINQVGTYNNWPTRWYALNSLNDRDDGLAQSRLDFVGNGMYPGGYWFADKDYIYFRVRVDDGTITPGEYSDTVMVLIDVAGVGTPGNPDYAFAWDSKSGDNSRHGLEMMVPRTLGTYWNTTRMDDLDGSSGQKLVNDINGGGRTTDGYVRTVDGQPLGGPGFDTDSSFVDFAVSWNYLRTYTGLDEYQTWYIQFGSIWNANDHNMIDYDIAGGVRPDQPLNTKWSVAIVAPEPSALVLLVLGSGAAILVRRRSARQI